MDSAPAPQGPLPPLSVVLSRSRLAHGAPLPSVRSYKSLVAVSGQHGAVGAKSSAREVKKKRSERPPAIDMKANMRRSKHRDKEKREIMFLRASCHALQKELEQLEHNRDKVSRADDRERRAWYALALIRKGERERSEAENAKLKALWKMQLQLAAQIQSLDAVPRSVGSSKNTRLILGAADAAVFRALFGDVDTTYSQMCKLLDATGLSRLPEVPYISIGDPNTSITSASPPFTQVLQPVEAGYSSSGPTKCLSLIEVDCAQSNLPFIHANVLRITESFITERGNSARFDIDGNQNESILAMKKQEISSFGGVWEAVDMFTVWKRYMISPDCEAIVWRSLNVGSGGLSGLSSIETSFVRFTRAQQNPECTIVRRMRRIEAMAQSTGSQASAANWGLLERFNSLCMNAIEEDTRKLTRDMDLQGSGTISMQK